MSSINTIMGLQVEGLRGPSAFKNSIINGNFDVWQKGTSFTADGTYQIAADMWTFFRGSLETGVTFSKSTDAPDGFVNAAKIRRVQGNTSEVGIYVRYTADIYDCVPLQGKTVTISFKAKKGSNYSATNSLFGLSVYTGTTGNELVRNLGTWGGVVHVGSANFYLTSDYETYTHTFTFDSDIKQFGLQFAMPCLGTAGEDDSVYITGVQLEIGNEASDFEIRPVETEFELCKRYFERIGYNDRAAIGVGYIYSTIDIVVDLHYSYKREIPAIKISDPAHFQIHRAGTPGEGGLTYMGVSSITNNSAFLSAIKSTASWTAGQSAMVGRLNTAGYIDISSELN